jgi:hypothetical protein
MIETAIFSKLSTATEVTDKVGVGNAARVYPVTLPQNITYPAIVFTRISGARTYSMDGPSGLASPRVQIDIYGNSVLEAMDLADRVRCTLNGLKETIGGIEILGTFLDTDRDDYNDTTETYRIIQDYIIHHKEAD